MRSSELFVSMIVLIAAMSWSQERQGAHAMSFKMNSAAFQSGGDIPSKYTCSGADVSPALSWSDPPEATRSLALIADDPDAPAGTWVHWVVYDIPASTRQLPEGVSKTDAISGGGIQGQNDFRRTGYGGPCPPPGKPHRYYFKLYALDSKLNLKPGATKKTVEQAMQGHIVGQTEIMGKFQR